MRNQYEGGEANMMVPMEDEIPLLFSASYPQLFEVRLPLTTQLLNL